jgi:hypothetical protein
MDMERIGYGICKRYRGCDAKRDEERNLEWHCKRNSFQQRHIQWNIDRHGFSNRNAIFL